MALACDPALIVADEPTTGLDAVTRDRLLDDLASLDDAVLLVSHDLAALAETATRLAVLHDGRVVETGPTAAVLGAPTNPHTAALRDAWRVGGGAWD